MADPPHSAPDAVEAFRARLPATSASIYLDTATAGPLPDETVAAMREIEDLELRFGRAAAAYREEARERVDEARAVLAAAVTGSPSSLALTHGAAAGMVAAVSATPLQPGDLLLVAGDGTAAAQRVLRTVGERAGARVVSLDVEAGDASDPLTLRLERAFAARPRAVVFPHVLPATGAVLPAAGLVRAARDVGATTIVDGSQAVGAIPVDVQGLDADFYAFPASTWLLGPEGMGGLWVSERALAGRDVRDFDAPHFHGPSVAGVARSVGWLAMFVGLPWVTERGPQLARRFAHELRDVPGLQVLTPRDATGTLVTLRVAGWSADQVREELARRVFADVGEVPGLDAIRLSIAAFTTDDELERVRSLLVTLATHTPETLPRRPSLVVIDARAGGAET